VPGAAQLQLIGLCLVLTNEVMIQASPHRWLAQYSVVCERVEGTLICPFGDVPASTCFCFCFFCFLVLVNIEVVDEGSLLGSPG
jgi:hypothetical protein